MQSVKLKLVINLVTVRMLGLEVPDSLLARADGPRTRRCLGRPDVL